MAFIQWQGPFFSIMNHLSLEHHTWSPERCQLELLPITANYDSLCSPKCGYFSKAGESLATDIKIDNWRKILSGISMIVVSIKFKGYLFKFSLFLSNPAENSEVN